MVNVSRELIIILFTECWSNCILVLKHTSWLY